MSIQSYLRVMGRHWILLLVLTVLGAASGMLFTATSPRVYVATTSQFVTGVPGTGEAADYQAAQFATSRAKSYSVFVGNPVVLNGIIEDLGLEMDPGEVYSRLTVENPIDTTLINVTARAPTADQAQDLSIAAADNLAKLIIRLESTSAAGKSPIEIQTAVPAPKPTTPTSPRPSLNLAIGTMLGLALGSIAALARDVRVQSRAARVEGSGPPTSAVPAVSPEADAAPAAPAALAEPAAPAAHAVTAPSEAAEVSDAGAPTQHPDSPEDPGLGPDASPEEPPPTPGEHGPRQSSDAPEGPGPAGSRESVKLAAINGVARGADLRPMTGQPPPTMRRLDGPTPT